MKLLFIIGLILPVFGFSQLHVELGGGISSATYQGINDAGKAETTKAILPAFKLAIGYEIGSIVIEVAEQPTLSRLVNSPKLFGLKAGYDINGFVPFVGYFIDHCNSDNTDYNSKFFGFGIKYSFQINDNGGLYIEGLRAGKNSQLTAGIHYKF